MSEQGTWMESVAQFGRTSLLGVTFIFTLLGVAASGASMSVGRLLATLAAALAFHVAVYVVNDIVDLPIDRTEARRAASPLVRGTVTVRQAATIAAASVAVALVLAASVAARAVVPMGVALASLLAYDVWGKRCPIPPLTDFIQGVGWAALVWFGSAAGASATRETVWLGIYVVVAILLVNGVHGAVRDLVNDQSHGALTTALWLGGKIDEVGVATIPKRLWIYAIALHLVDVAVLLVALATDDGRRWLEMTIVLSGGGACLFALVLGLARAGQQDASWLAGFAYIIVMLLLPVTLVVDSLRGALLAALVVLFVVPWLSSRFVRAFLPMRVHHRGGALS